MPQTQPDLFILYPVFFEGTKEPMFDGDFFLAEKHFMQIVGTISLTRNGKSEVIDQIRCLRIQPVKVRPEEVVIGEYKLWGVKQRITS